ncbi:MAG: DinB family protein [Bacteroidetes bacterium]|nr:DinB family protein [Bacteroidota bacterium]
MTRSEIATRLREDHKRFAVMLSSQTDEDFVRAADGKWTAGHQLDHIYRSVVPLRTAMQLPGFVPRLLFGRAKAPSHSYEEVVAKYKERLSAGGQAVGRYRPKPVSVSSRNRQIIKLTDTVEKLAKKVEKMDEEKLDSIVLPHPLLGKITLREMLHFTIYHVGHHHKATLKNLGK